MPCWATLFTLGFSSSMAPSGCSISATCRARRTLMSATLRNWRRCRRHSSNRGGRPAPPSPSKCLSRCHSAIPWCAAALTRCSPTPTAAPPSWTGRPVSRRTGRKPCGRPLSSSRSTAWRGPLCRESRKRRCAPPSITYAPTPRSLPTNCLIPLSWLHSPPQAGGTPRPTLPAAAPLRCYGPCPSIGRAAMGNCRSRKLSGLDEPLTAQPGHQLAGVLRIPEDHASPIRVITRRVAIALVVLFGAAIIVYLDRNGYRDVRGEPPTFLDCVYFAAVSLSTTGYGDITPYTEPARLVHTVIFTPLRIAFLAVLVGTTLEVLSERSRQAWKIQRWRSKVRNHTVVIGYGTKGKTAVAAILGDESAHVEIVVCD